MLRVLLRALRCHRWLCWMAIGFLLSSLGNGFTFIIVFGELLRLEAPVSSLALAYMLSTLPGWFGSQVGERFCRNIDPFHLLIAGELLGAVMLVFPLAGMHRHSIALLMLAQASSSLITGITFPAVSLLFKRGLSQAELPAATCFETLIFATHVLLGVGVGVVLYPSVAGEWLLAVTQRRAGFTAALCAQSAAIDWPVIITRTSPEQIQ